MMKNLFLLILTLFFSMMNFAQKAEVKNDKIMVGGTAIATIETDGCKAISPTCSFYISNLDGEALMTIVALDMNDPQQINSGNPDGKVRFLRYSFSGIDGAAEVKNPALFNTKPKDVIQNIASAKLIKEGQLDENAVKNFMNANGTRFTDRQKEMNPSVIIIDGRR